MQNLIRIYSITVVVLLSNNYIYAQKELDDSPQIKKNAKILYRTNNLLVINDSLLYDFDSTTAVPFPNFNSDSLISKGRSITAISSKKRMNAMGYDTLYSAIYFIRLGKEDIDHLIKH